MHSSRLTSRPRGQIANARAQAAYLVLKNTYGEQLATLGLCLPHGSMQLADRPDSGGNTIGQHYVTIHASDSLVESGVYAG